MYAIGIDIGGTNLPAGIVDLDTMKILKKRSRPFVKGMPAETAFDELAAISRELLHELDIPMSEVLFAGAGFPGVLMPSTGYLVHCNNLDWFDLPASDMLAERLGCRVYIDNDANAAAWGEYTAGACKGSRSAVMLTLGTGLGGGVIIDGKILWGSYCNGGEIGHTILVADGEPCTCGNRGCVERYTAATALIRWGREALADGISDALKNACGADSEKITAKMVVDLARENDPACSAIFKKYIHYLALECVSLVNFVDPEVIVIGGGVSGAGDFLMDPLREEYESLIVNKSNKHAEIRLATLGNDAGIIGAALLGRM